MPTIFHQRGTIPSTPAEYISVWAPQRKTAYTLHPLFPSGRISVSRYLVFSHTASSCFPFCCHIYFYLILYLFVLSPQFECYIITLIKMPSGSARQIQSVIPVSYVVKLSRLYLLQRIRAMSAPIPALVFRAVRRFGCHQRIEAQRPVKPVFKRDDCIPIKDQPLAFTAVCHIG